MTTKTEEKKGKAGCQPQSPLVLGLYDDGILTRTYRIVDETLQTKMYVARTYSVRTSLIDGKKFISEGELCLIPKHQMKHVHEEESGVPIR